MAKLPASIEPNMDTAFQWWCEPPDKWTPVGWKNHLFRFNVEYNGAIVARPNLNSRTDKWEGQGVQLGIYPKSDLQVPDITPLWRDDGGVIQGWKDCDAPVLWSEWAHEGLILRSEVFAHVPGAKDVETGVEPLFAWVRLSVHDRIDELPLEDQCGFVVAINAPHLAHTMFIRNNTYAVPHQRFYPRPLRPEQESYDPSVGYKLLEEDGKTRMAVAPGQQCGVEFKAIENGHESQGASQGNEYLMLIHMSSEKGTHVDLLVPMLPAEKGIFDTELSVGYDRALEEANRYWSEKPATAALFDTPEDHVNRTIEQSLKFAEIIAEKNPADGKYSELSGSWIYANVWATPNSMTLTMLLDTMGYYSATDRYLEVFRETQGTIKPPGDDFSNHRGYLAVPRNLRSVDWLSDHGAVLWAVSEHGLLSGDRQFIEKWTPGVIKACEFIENARKIKGHGGFEGIMPPAIATDMNTKIQAVWSDGWMYKGLTTAVRLLKRIKNPRAAEFETAARDYRAAFVKAFREKMATMPIWTDRQGKERHLAPTSLYGDNKLETRFPFYLDTGPLFLVFAGLLDPGDEAMRSTLLWFREGPQTRAYRHDSSWLQVPCLRHEMSSCEPVYSWNVFHPWKSGDRTKFLEGMYSLFAGYVSRQTYTSCETRGGIYGLTPALVPGYMARLAVIDDQIAEGDLHLLRLVPRAWLRKDRESRFANIPTEFGPVTLRAKLSSNGKELQAHYEPGFRETPKRVVLHVPPVRGLERIFVNGRNLEWDGKASILSIS